MSILFVMGTRRNRSGGSDPLNPQSLLAAFLRLDPRARIVVLAALVIVGIGIILYEYSRHHAPPPPLVQSTSAPTGAAASSSSVNMLLGNPSGATPDPANKNNYLMVKPYFTLSYNDSAGIPNWVSWRVSRADMGDAPRKPLFDPDTTLPAGFKRVAHKDYSGSGFDRGHLCPHSDRAANQQMSFATFVMTNIIPQAPNVNQGAWAQMENYCRDLVRKRHRLYIMAGPDGRGGRGSNGLVETLANGKVVVPAECWKIVVVVSDEGSEDTEDDLAKISLSTRVIAVLMPNDNSAVGEEWAKFRTSPAEIERKTGLRFFDRLPTEVGEALKEKVDTEPIAAPRAMGQGRD